MFSNNVFRNVRLGLPLTLCMEEFRKCSVNIRNYLAYIQA